MIHFQTSVDKLQGTFELSISLLSRHGFWNDRGNVFTPLFLQFRSELCVPKRMEVMKKAISERDFKTFAETTMKVSLRIYRPARLLPPYVG